MLREQNQDIFAEFEQDVRAGDLVALVRAVGRCKFERRIPGWLADAILKQLDRASELPDRRDRPGRTPSPLSRYKAGLARVVRAWLVDYARRTKRELRLRGGPSAFALAHDALQGTPFAVGSPRTLERDYYRLPSACGKGAQKGRGLRVNFLHVLQAVLEPSRRVRAAVEKAAKG